MNIGTWVNIHIAGRKVPGIVTSKPETIVVETRQGKRIPNRFADVLTLRETNPANGRHLPPDHAGEPVLRHPPQHPRRGAGLRPGDGRGPHDGGTGGPAQQRHHGPAGCEPRGLRHRRDRPRHGLATAAPPLARGSPSPLAAAGLSLCQGSSMSHDLRDAGP
jgi:hypothetical protein